MTSPTQRTIPSETARGFSLFGLLLYIGLTTVLLTALGEITIGVLAQSAQAENDRSTVYTLSFLQARLKYEIGRAEAVITPTLGNPASSLTLLSEGKTITYFVADGRMWVHDSLSDPEVLTPEDVVISSLLFETVSSPAQQQPIRTRIETGTRNFLRREVLSTHGTTTFTFYPYVYE